MGQRIRQRILVCDICGKRTPDDGKEPMWEMGREVVVKIAATD